jgi:adenylosuccinate synthase
MDALTNNGIDYSKKLHISDRCHFITELHRKICANLKDIRQDKIWLDSQDICSSFKPARLGLRVCHLTLGSWADFVDKYDRVQNTVEKLYRVELTKEEKNADLEHFRRLKDILLRYKLVEDTVLLIN